jgi:hypothetical protein
MEGCVRRLGTERVWKFGIRPLCLGMFGVFLLGLYLGCLGEGESSEIVKSFGVLVSHNPALGVGEKSLS